jgi:glycerol-3-phosphate dehydrogenase (NAD(P)+)
MDSAALLERARERGVNPFVYWFVRGILQPFFHLYFRLSRVGREHIPESGPVIFAANHRSFLDPFVIGTLLKRPVYYVAKQELFANRLIGWILNSLGAFPVDRGHGDQDSMATARAILERGDAVVIFPEGTRTRPGSLGRPKRGVGRLALETGAPVIPVAVIGTEDIRRGWRVRPHKVRIRCGSPLHFPRVETASINLAGAVTDRIWPCVMLQWEWLGGMPPLRRAAVVGAGSTGTSVAAILARAGLQVELGCRTREYAEAEALVAPEGVTAVKASEIEFSTQDVVVFACAARELPTAVAAYAGRIPARSGVLVLSKGLVAPLGTLPSEFVSERVRARAVACLGGPVQDPAELDHGASLVLACADEPFGLQLSKTLEAGGFDTSLTADVEGVELAGCAKDAAGLAASIASTAGPAVAGTAAGKVFDEIWAYARDREHSRADTFTGLAGAGDLVATVLANETDAAGRADAVDSVPLLAGLLRDAGVAAPTVDGLSDLIEGRIEADRWTAGVTAPARAQRRSVRAA